MSVTYVWIRHGKKMYKNGKSGGTGKDHDSPLDQNEIQNIRELRDRLIALHGEPSLIISSPFLRTRETALLLNGEETLKRVRIDSLISEFLGHQKGDLDVSDETKEYGIYPIGESIDSLNKRINNHLFLLTALPITFEKDNGITPPRNQAIEERSTVFWIVTHGIIIEKIHEQLAENLDDKGTIKYPQELKGLTYKRGYNRHSLSTDIVKALYLNKNAFNEAPLEKLNSVAL